MTISAAGNSTAMTPAEVEAFAEAMEPYMKQIGVSIIQQGEGLIKSSIEQSFGDENPGKKAVNIELA